MSESKTPRTDANDMRHQFNQQYGYNSSLDDDPVEWADFARQLETELAEVTRQRDELKEQNRLFRNETLICADCDAVRKIEYDEAIRKRDELAEALIAYREALHDGPDNCTYRRYEEVDELAKQALETP